MKKYISFFIALAVAIMPFGITYADVSDIESKTYTLSLDNAIELAIDKNAEIVSNEYKQSAAKLNVKSAYLTRAPYKNAVVNVSSQFETYCLKEGYYIKAAEMSERLTLKEGEKLKNTVAYKVTEAYYNVVLMQKLVNAALNSYNLALANANIVYAQYELGLISDLDYENAVISVDSAKNSLDSYKRSYDMAQQNLKIILGIDEENCVLELTDEIEYQIYESDVETDISSAMETRYDITALKESMALAYEYFDLSTVLTDGSATYNTAYADYLVAQNNYENGTKNIALMIQSAYNSISDAKASMSICERQYNIMIRMYDSIKLKYELGLVSNQELTSAINDLYNAQVSYANAKLTYKMAVEKYKFEITLGL